MRASDRYSLADVDFRAMESRGYVVVPEFLDREEIEGLRADFESREVAANTNYQLIFPTAEAVLGLKSKLSDAAEEVTKATEIRCEFGGLHHAYYFASEILTFGSWHQDNESYYAVQNHYDYLNFWMPVVKPRIDLGNLGIIPWDSLKREAPDAYARLREKGGTTFIEGARETLVYDDGGEVARLPFQISELAVIPETSPGDLVLLRGDVIHRTEAVDKTRVALSVRLTNPAAKLEYRELARGGFRKTRMQARSWEDFGPLYGAFARSGRRELSWREASRSGEADDLAGMTPGQASRYILRRKFEMGLLTDALIRSCANALANYRAKQLLRKA